MAPPVARAGLVGPAVSAHVRKPTGAGGKQRVFALGLRCFASLREGADATERSDKFKYKIDLEGLVSLCKRRGFIFPSSDVYGGYGGFFDYGPLGVELKNNVKQLWWRRMVHGKDNVVGLDTSIISSPRVHEASGHVENFSDPMVDCTKSGKRFRADQLMWARVETQSGEVVGFVSGVDCADIGRTFARAAKRLVKASGLGKGSPLKPLAIRDMTEATPEEVSLIPSPSTGIPGSLTSPRSFNLMFETNVGPYGDASSRSYLRPETAQGIFVNFKNVATVSRLKVPFGIAQIGKAFRNEISTRQFVFRSREFEQMELEYFIDPEADFRSEQETWLAEMWSFLRSAGLREELLSKDEHSREKLAHYALACTDVLFEYPFGRQELLGVAARGSFDLEQHARASGEALEFHDQPAKRRFTPHVIEPSLGVDRLVLALLCSAYDEDEVGGERRSLLRFEPCVAPIICGVFPLMKNTPALLEKAKGLAAMLRERGLNVAYDDSGSIGRRYRRMDEVGTPFCCTVDFETLEDDTVTLRDRDDPLSVRRIPREEVAAVLWERRVPRRT